MTEWNSDGSLKDKVAIVTGASRGIGKGIALELGAAGATVYVTGRTVTEGAAALPGTIGATAEELTELGGQGIAVQCDHSDDGQINAMVKRVEDEQGGIDILVNNAFTVPDVPIFETRFWEMPVDIWDQLHRVGCRGHYVASCAVASKMVERRTGFIVNISSFAGAAYVFNVAYGVGKAAVDRMAKDMAQELREFDVTAVSLWPGIVRTEHMLQAHKAGTVPFDIDRGESPRFTGRGVVSLAADPKLHDKTGRVIPVVDLASEYGFKDIDGQQPGNLGEQMGFS